MARTRTRTFRVVPEDTRTWDLFLKDFLGGLEDVQIDEMADLAGLSVMGRASGTAGPPAAITATVDGHVLRLSGGALGFGTITTASLSDFTESAQDAIGTALANSATVTLTYNDATPSFTAALVADSVSNSFLADMGQATVKGRAFGSGTGDPVDLTVAQVSAIVDHDQTTNFAANEHIDHTAVTITAGTGLTGGGDISAGRTLNVGAGTGISVAADAVAVDLAATFPWTGPHSWDEQIQVVPGSAGTPSIASTGDPNTGLFWNGGDILSFSAGGSTVFALTTTIFRVVTQIQSNDGSAAAPAFSFDNDPDCGIFRQGANAVGVATNGAEVGRFDASTTAGQTRFLIYDVDNGTLERVTVGAADSGGAGFKVLRIPN